MATNTNYQVRSVACYLLWLHLLWLHLLWLHLLWLPILTTHTNLTTNEQVRFVAGRYAARMRSDNALDMLDFVTVAVAVTP